MTLVKILAVGALVKPEGDDRYRPKIRGDRVSVSDDDARKLAADGTAVILDRPTAEDAEVPQPQPGAFDLDEMTVPELRKFADARRIDLGGAKLKPEIIESIDAALQDGG